MVSLTATGGKKGEDKMRLRSMKIRVASLLRLNRAETKATGFLDENKQSQAIQTRNTGKGIVVQWYLSFR